MMRPIVQLRAALVLLAVLSYSLMLASAQAQQEYSCDNIAAIPEGERCAFVLKECESDSRIPYTQIYYCHVAPHGLFARGCFILLLAAALPLFFCLLGDTAELYFSPTMALVSQTIPKMRPRFAGVTFVAIGNGAPDLSSNISAIRNGQVALSAGAFTGACMFVQCVVASEVIRVSKGVRCRGATLRDVAIFTVSIVGVGLAFSVGYVTRWFVAGAIAMYLVYAAWVFAGDEWHARGRPRLQPDLGWGDLRAILLQKRYGTVDRGSTLEEEGQYAEALLPWAAVDEDGAAVTAGGRGYDSGAENGHGKKAQAGAVSSLGADDFDGGGGGGSFGARGGGDGAAPLIAVEEEEIEGIGGGSASRGPPRSRAAGPGAGAGGQMAQGAGASRQGSSSSAAMHRAGSTTAGAGGHASAAGGGSHASAAAAHLLDARLYKEAVWADLSSEASQKLRRAIASSGSGLTVPGPGPGAGAGAGAAGAGPGAAGAGQPGLRGTAAVQSPQRGHGLELQQAASGSFLALPAGQGAGPGERQPLLLGDVEGGGGGSATGLAPMGSGSGSWGVWDGASSPGPREGSPRMQAAVTASEDQGPWHQVAWNQLVRELTLGNSEEWAEMAGWRRSLREATFKLLLPFYAALRLTIPLVDPPTYSQQWLVVSILCSPLAVVVYLDAFGIPAVVTAMAVGAVTAGVVHVLTKDEEELPALDCGTKFAFGPALFSLLGFAMGVMWIDSLASEVVGIVSLLCQLLAAPPALVGLTVLAWGNSLGDFFGNPAMAKRGHSSMALTACFAGPLFNMLMSLALGFSAYFAKQGVHKCAVYLSPEVLLGIVMLVIYNLALAAVGLVNKFHIPERFYLFARLWYGLYFGLACVLGFRAALSGTPAR